MRQSGRLTNGVAERSGEEAGLCMQQTSLRLANNSLGSASFIAKKKIRRGRQSGAGLSLRRSRTFRNTWDAVSRRRKNTQTDIWICCQTFGERSFFSLLYFSRFSQLMGCVAGQHGGALRVWMKEGAGGKCAGKTLLSLFPPQHNPHQRALLGGLL